MKKKVLLTKKYFDADLEYLHHYLDKDCELIVPDTYDEQGLISHSADANALLGGFVSKDLLQNAKHLELIQIPWTGVDKFNFDALQYTAAKVCNSHSNSAAVAEFAVALFFSAVKMIPYHDHELRSGNWNRPRPDGNDVSPFAPMVSSMTIGIMGFGAIGKKIQSMLRSFGCEFIVYNTSPVENHRELGIRKVYGQDQLKEFVAACDSVFVCLPLTDKTTNLLDRSILSAFKKDSYIINVSRGEIINEKDLFDLLQSNYLKAGIDTWWKAPQGSASFPSNLEYQDLNNVVMSPHRAGMVEGDLPHLADAVTNLNNLCAGRDLINQLNSKNKY